MMDEARFGRRPEILGLVGALRTEPNPAIRCLELRAHCREFRVIRAGDRGRSGNPLEIEGEI